jgi:hypothetical protein
MKDKVKNISLNPDFDLILIIRHYMPLSTIIGRKDRDASGQKCN